MTNSLLTVACTLFMFGAGQVCVPCEENTRCEIAYAFQYTGSGLDQLIWSIGGIDAVVCHTRNGNECELYPDFKGVVFSKIEKQSDFMTTNIQFTADRNNQLLTAKKWELVYSSTVVYTCDVHYYKKIDQAMCHHKISKKGLHIECTSANVYPKSCCNFSVKVNRASWDIQLTPEYNRTVVKTDPVYFDTVCALDIAPADLESGVWEVNVTMYPDIFNDDGKNCKPTNGGKTFLFNITIEHPFISLYNCPNAVEDGKEFNCICQRDDKSDVHTVVYWKKQGANRSNNNISAVLIATAKKEETGFTCIAENVIRWKTIFNYNIAIFDSSWKQLSCPKEKPYNCIADCYSDNEFCLHGKVYGCVSANVVTLQQWCQSVEHSERITCKTMCGNHGLNAVKNENNYVIFVLSVCSIFPISVTIVLFCLWNLRKRKKEVKLSEVTSISHLKNDTKYNHNHVQKNLKDVAVTCNKQPEETVSYEQSSVKVNKSDKQCNFPKHMSQGGCSKGTVDIATTTHVVFYEEEAKCTTAELFDDEDKSGAKNKSLQDERFNETDQHGECVVQCETCDEDLCEKLASALTEQRELSKNSFVSHTHGKSKHICFGRRSQVKDGSDVTCPGYYGASVLMVHSESRSVHVEVHGKGNGFRPTGPPEKVPLLRPLKKVHL